MATPFGQMSDDEVNALAQKLGVQMPGRAPIPAGSYFAPNAGTAQQIVPLGGGPLGDPARPDPNAAPLPGANPFGQATLPPPPGPDQAWFKPPAAGLAGAEAKPVAGPDPSAFQSRQPGQPFAAPEKPFTPTFVPTGMPGVGGGVFANNRDEQIAALAEQTAFRTAGGLNGTGFGANGDYYSPNGAAYQLHAAGLGQQAGADVMKLLAGSDASQEQARQAEANRQAEVAKAQIAGQAHVAGAAAAHSPDALRGAGSLKLLDMIAQGNANPENLKLATEFLGSLHGGHAPGAQPAPGQPTGPADILAKVQGIKQGREGTLAALNAFGGPDPTGAFQQAKGLGVSQAEQFADTLTQMQDPAQRAAVMRSVMEGKFGDRTPILQAITQAAAKNSYLAGGMPLTDLRSMKPSQIPGQVTLPYGDRPLLSLGSSPEGGFPLGRRIESAAAGGVPWNQIQVQGGPTVPFNPGDLGGWFGSSVLGKKPDPKVYGPRASVLMEALNNAYPQQPR